jgi:regulator of protease activity HflC (stomatin/prohibitin superfamily)
MKYPFEFQLWGGGRMFGIRYFKAPPTTFVMQFKSGRVRREGNGLSFFYFAPSTTLVAVPVGSSELPFIFNEITADFQAVTVQGQITFRVADAKKLAGLMDYSLKPNGEYASDDREKLGTRITNVAQNATRAEVLTRSLRAAVVEADAIGQRVIAALKGSATLQALGIEVLEFIIQAIKPMPETSKALEAEAREKFLREADDAVYLRRNNAVEQERKIRENELNTEIAVQEKQRQIDEAGLAAKVALEEGRKALVELESANNKIKADAEAYAMEQTLKPLAALDPKSLQVLAARNVDPRLMVSMAFQELAANAEKVGTLNISPELLQALMQPDKPNR